MICKIYKKAKSLILADKNNNLYELTTVEFDKLLIEKISKTYKKATTSAINAKNTELKAIAKRS